MRFLASKFLDQLEISFRKKFDFVALTFKFVAWKTRRKWKLLFNIEKKVMKNFEASWQESWKVFFIKFRFNFSLRIMANNKALKRKKKRGLHVYANDIILFRLLFQHFCIHLGIAHKNFSYRPLPPISQTDPLQKIEKRLLCL